MSQPTCVVCGDEFEQRKGGGPRRRFCSRRCEGWFYRNLSDKMCGRDGCGKPMRARGLCSTHYNQEHAPERHGKHLVACAACGTLVIKGGGGGVGRRPVCSTMCRHFLQWGVWPSCPVPRFSRALVGPVAATHRPWSGTVVASTRATFVSGPCQWCGEQFTVACTGTLGRSCSTRCATKAAKARRGKSFQPSLRLRREVYIRDGYVCQLCGEPTDPTSGTHEDWYPSLDHIVPRSKGGADTAENLRTAHRWCNAVRGDESHDTFARLMSA